LLVGAAWCGICYRLARMVGRDAYVNFFVVSLSLCLKAVTT
jgi:hypothetical protein